MLGAEDLQGNGAFDKGPPSLLGGKPKNWNCPSGQFMVFGQWGGTLCEKCMPEEFLKNECVMRECFRKLSPFCEPCLGYPSLTPTHAVKPGRCKVLLTAHTNKFESNLLLQSSNGKSFNSIASRWRQLSVLTVQVNKMLIGSNTFPGGPNRDPARLGPDFVRSSSCSASLSAGLPLRQISVQRQLILISGQLLGLGHQ